MTPRLATAVESAVTNAVRYLMTSRDERGAWKDFFLPAGRSDVWVTAFVGEVLSTTTHHEAREAAEDAWRFLEQAARPEGGWSYNRGVPGDGDSTLWGLRLAGSLGLANARCAVLAAAFLEQHARPDGGVTTYATPDAVRRYTGLPASISFAGWTRSHVCVTAAAAHLASHASRLRDPLARHQAADGSWPAYWWFDDEYATAEAVAALAGGGVPADGCEPGIDARIDLAVRWALDRAATREAPPGVEAPAFAAAHGLRVLARGRRPEQVSQALSSGLTDLLSWQKPNGAFPASARLRVPRPDVEAPNARADWRPWTGKLAGPPSLAAVLESTFTTYSLDHDAVYTTATVLRALNEIQRLAGWR